MAVDSVPGNLSRENGAARARRGRHAPRHVDVLGERRHGQVARRHLLGRAGGADPQHRRCPSAGALSVGERPRKLFTLERPGLQFARVVASTAKWSRHFAVVYLPLADVMT